MGFLSSLGKAIGGLVGGLGGPALGPIGLFAAPIFGTLDGLFGGGGGGGGSAQQGGFAAIPQNTTAGSTVNSLKKLEQIPAVIGTMRVSPPAVTPAWTEINQREDLIVNQIFALQGEHDLSDIQINGGDISSFDDDEVEIQTRPGTDSDTPLTLITQSVFEDILNIELPGFKYENLEPNTLRENDPIAESRPKWVYQKTKDNPDEIWVDLYFPRGLTKTAPPNSTAIRMTVGGRKLPSIRMRSRQFIPIRLRIKLVFTAAPAQFTPFDHTNDTFPAVLFNRVVAESTEPTESDWEADPYFGAYEAATGTVTSSNSLTENYSASNDTCTFYLDPNDATNPWPKQAYEIGLQRGFGGTGLSLVNADRYHSIKSSGGDWVLGTTATRDASETSQLVLRSISTVRYEHPVNTTGFALIAVRARNITINNLSVLASGKTKNWDGADWDTVEATSNPAAWLRRLRTDPYLAHPLPDSVRDDTSLQELHDFCETEGLTVNMVVEDGRAIEDDLFEQICSAAYSKKNNGAIWGVWIDKDRSAEEPVGAITPLNSGELTITRSFDEIPEALRVRWRDSTNDYSVALERIIYRAGFTSSTPNLKIVSVEAPGKVTEADVDEWATRALDEMTARTTTYRCTVDIEALQYGPGDLLALAYDTVTLKVGFGFVKSIQTSGPNVTGITTEKPLSLSKAGAADPWAADNVWDLSTIWQVDNLGLGIRQEDGTITHHAINEYADTDTVTFVTPFASPTYLSVGSLVWAGVLNSEARRVYVDSMTGINDFGVEIVCVDEAPSIHP